MQKGKFLAGLMSVSMVLSVVPAPVFAEETAGQTVTSEVQDEEVGADDTTGDDTTGDDDTADGDDTTGDDDTTDGDDQTGDDDTTDGDDATGDDDDATGDDDTTDGDDQTGDDDTTDGDDDQTGDDNQTGDNDQTGDDDTTDGDDTTGDDDTTDGDDQTGDNDTTENDETDINAACDDETEDDETEDDEIGGEAGDISVREDILGGSVEIVSDITSIKIGDEVTVRPTADKGYDLMGMGFWTVTVDEDGNETTSSIEAMKKNSDGTYYFTMPKGDVRIGASFQPADHLQITTSGSYIYEPGKEGNSLTVTILSKFAHLYESDTSALVQLALDKKFFDEYKDDNLTFSVQIRTHKDNKYYVLGEKTFTRENLLKQTYELKEDYRGEKYYLFDTLTVPFTKNMIEKALVSDRKAYAVVQVINNDGTWVNAKGAEIKGYADGTSVNIVENADEVLEPIVFLYNLSNKTYHGRLLRTMLADEDITFIDITKENMGQNLGYMAGWSKYAHLAVDEKDAYMDVESSKRYILMANLSNALGNKVSDCATKLNTTTTRAYFKDFAASKNFYDYALHTDEEASATSAAMKWGILIGDVGDYLAADGYDTTTDPGKSLKAAYEAAIDAYTDEEEHEPSYYEAGYTALLDAYLEATGKVRLKGELELKLTVNEDGSYEVTPVHHREDGDTAEYELKYGWFNNAKAYTYTTNQSLTIDAAKAATYPVSIVNLTMGAKDDDCNTYGFLFARLLTPTEPEFTVSTGKTVVSVTVEEVQEEMNMPEIEKYVVALYQGDTLIEEKTMTEAGTIRFEGLTKGTEYMVEVYAENAVGFSDYADATVRTSKGSSGGGSSSSSKKEEVKTEETTTEDVVTEDTTVEEETEKEETKEDTSAKPSVSAAEKFSDVKENDWFAPAVSFVYEKGLMSGVEVDEFGAYTTTSRAMLWTILARMDGVTTSSDGAWYEAGKEWAMKNGISDGTDPMGNITREQLASMLYRYAKHTGDVTTTKEERMEQFKDNATISAYAVQAMNWAVSEGIVSGNDDQTLNPTGSAQRAHTAQMLMNFMKNR